MELLKAIEERRSIRKFKSDSISDEQIDLLVTAGFKAPSACNSQPWVFNVVSSKEVLDKLKKATRYTDYDAPLAIVVSADSSRMLQQPMKDFWIQDCSAATENILLQATSMGLASVWCGIYPMKEAIERVQEYLNLKEDEIPLNIIYIGYADSEGNKLDKYKKELIRYY